MAIKYELLLEIFLILMLIAAIIIVVLKFVTSSPQAGGDIFSQLINSIFGFFG